MTHEKGLFLMYNIINAMARDWIDFAAACMHSTHCATVSVCMCMVLIASAES